jgi:hypothetical protein
MGNERTMYITSAEAWALDDLIRHTWTDEGKQIGRGFLLKVFAVIKEFEHRKSELHPPEVLPIGLTEEECWMIDYHVRRSYVDPDGYRIGRPLLLKVFGLILEMRNQESVRSLRMPDSADQHGDQSDIARRFEEWRERLNPEKEDTSPPETGSDATA